MSRLVEPFRKDEWRLDEYGRLEFSFLNSASEDAQHETLVSYLARREALRHIKPEEINAGMATALSERAQELG